MLEMCNEKIKNLFNVISIEPPQDACSLKSIFHVYNCQPLHEKCFVHGAKYFLNVKRHTINSWNTLAKSVKERNLATSIIV